MSAIYNQKVVANNLHLPGSTGQACRCHQCRCTGTGVGGHPGSTDGIEHLWLRSMHHISHKQAAC